MLNLHSIILIICNILIIVQGIYDLIGPGKTEDDFMYCPYIVDMSILAGSMVMSMILGVFGICAAIFEKKILRWTYLLVVVIVSIVLIISSVLGPMTSRKITEEQIMEENQLKYFPRQVQEVFIRGDKWNRLKECYIRAHTCDKIKKEFQQIGPLNQKAVFLQVGCCLPSEYCLLKWLNDTSLKTTIGKDRVCENWDKSKDIMCVDCESCKAAHLAVEMKSMADANGRNILSLIFVLVLFAYTCYAFNHDNDCENQQGYLKQPPQSLPIYR